jgi:ribonucleoside-triphosphate reductase
MSQRMQKVKKRDNRIVPYDDHKIFEAIRKANKDSKDKKMKISEIFNIVKLIEEKLNDVKIPSVEHIQDVVENTLIKTEHINTAKSYIVYRHEHAQIRDSQEDLMNKFMDLTFKSAEDFESKRDNANINSDSAMGIMLKYGTESSNYFNDNYIIPKEYVEAHRQGYIHMHDKDFQNLTFNCIQLDLLKLLHGGFSTGHGFIREPQNIRSYASLACIAIQSNQNDMFGGQSIATFDYAMAEGVRKTFKKEFIKTFDYIMNFVTLNDELKAKKNEIINFVCSHHIPTYGNIDACYKDINDNFDSHLAKLIINDIIVPADKITTKKVEDETYQAMESVIHNLNSMHSRAGAQVPFSSINLGTDCSPEGRLVIEKFLLSEERGLGDGETPIFPIVIFKLKKGVNYDENDPNYYLFKLAMRVSAKRLFPNFESIDAPYNLQYYKPDDPRTEIATMGCRTRTLSNIYDPDNAIVTSRGNFSFTTINLPKIAIESNHDMKKFYKKLDELMELCKEQLLWRFKLISRKHVYNFPFLMGQGVWINSDKLRQNDEIGEVLKEASISIGFCGLAECLVSLIGKHHGESEEAQKLGLEIISHMRNVTDSFAKQHQLNFTLFATPAESTAGTFAKSNRKQYGIIPGVTDKTYETNSFHVPPGMIPYCFLFDFTNVPAVLSAGVANNVKFN